MTDAKTLAYINLYGILGALENLCELDEEASKLAQVKKPLSIAFSVKDHFQKRKVQNGTGR